METFGRERRHRYYTVAAFRALIAREGLDDSAASYADIDYSAIGGFASISPNAFYEDEKTLMTYADSFKDKLNAGNRKYKLKNPIMPDGSVKIGRPRKKPANGSQKGRGKAAAAGRKRKREVGDQEDVDNREANGDASVKPKRGRPPKKSRLDTNLEAEDSNQISTQGVGGQGRTEVVSAKKLGRPPKKKPSGTTQEADGPGVDQPASSEEGATAPKKRGRPPKQKPNVFDHTADGTQQTTGEDGEAMSTSEGAPPKKRSRTTKQCQTPPPRTWESDKPAQDSVNETITSRIDLGAPPEHGNVSVGNVIAGSSDMQLEETRRSLRKRKPVFREDNFLSTKQTPRKNPVLPGGISMLSIKTPQDRNVNLTVGESPLLSSESQSAVPSGNLTAPSVSVGPVRMVEGHGHDHVPEVNVGLNTTVTCARMSF